MPLLRRYTSTNNGRLTVVHYPPGAGEQNLSEHYQNVVVPPWGLVEADVEVWETAGVREYRTKLNGVTAETVMAGTDLLRLVQADEGLAAGNPRRL